MADKKRKGADNKTPAKKRKVETPKSAKNTPKNTKASPVKKVTSTKAKKPEPKKAQGKTPAKTPARNATKTPAKTASKTPAKTASKTPAAKTSPTKAAKTPAKAIKKTPQVAKTTVAKKETHKQNVKNVAMSSITRGKLTQTQNAASKAKLQMAKSLKAKAAATAKSKLKTTKAVAKVQAVKTTTKPASTEKKQNTQIKKPEPKVETKKSESKQQVKKAEDRKKETPKVQKAADKKVEKKPIVPEPAAKRKIAEIVEDEQPRKRRTITPNKKFADYELDVPAKRTITPNKKYADYETDTTAKKEKSELRSFIQDKKKTPVVTASTEPTKTGSPKKSVEKKDSPSREITVVKPNEMKPAEKLMKKLQKKLEKEAKSASVPKPTESKDKAKIKITKVVTYDKPMSSDEKEMRAINKASKSPTKAKVDAVKKRVDTIMQKTPKATEKQTSGKIIKSTPKASAKTVKPPEKLPPKPKKIKEIKKEDRPVQTKFTCEASIKLPDDNKDVQCWITGIAVFPSGEIIMVDMANRKIKLFSKDLEFLSQVKLETIPQDISVSPVNVSDAYITKPFSKEGIQKITLSDGKLILKESFWTNGTNRGITCTKAGILTSVQDGRYHDLDINHFKIDLLDYEGKVLQSVSTDLNGSRLFKLPLYFTVNSTGKQMIVADCIKNLSYVVSVDMSGKVRFKYEGINNNLVTPRGLTIDDEDNIYVTEWEKHNVYILSPTGKRLQLLFSNEELREEGLDGLLKPYQLCFYKKDNTRCLLVSQEGCNTIKVFTLLRKGPETEAAAAAAAKAAEQKNLLNGEAKSHGEGKTTDQKNESPVKVVQKSVKVDEKKPANAGTPRVITIPGKASVNKPAENVPEKVATQSEEKSSVSSGTQVTDIPQQEEPAAVVPTVITVKPTETPAPKPIEIIVEKPAEPPLLEPIEQPVEQNETNVEQQTVSVAINPEFGDDFEANENEEIPAVQNAIDSLNDTKENQIEIQTMEAQVDASEVQVQIYDQMNVPQPQMVSILPQQHQINEQVLQQQVIEQQVIEQQTQVMEAVETSSEEIIVQQTELVNSEYQQSVGIPQVQDITAQTVIGTEIHPVPVDNLGDHQTIVYQEEGDEGQTQYIVTVSDPENGVLQTENVQYVTSVGIPDETYTASIVEGAGVAEIPEEMVTIVTENV